jgi:hypothetical protein
LKADTFLLPIHTLLHIFCVFFFLFFSHKGRRGLNSRNRLDDPTSPESYFGRVGELCVPCPVGAICSVPPEPKYTDPISKKGFFRITHNTTTKLEEATKRCDPKRVKASALKAEKFPSIIDKGYCFDFVGCSPNDPNPCLGNNKCARGYEHILHKCDAWQDSNPRERSLCRSDSDCRTRSGRSDWNIEENCGLAHPEDCAVCNFTKPVTNVTGLTLPPGTGRLGTCSCSQPRRCALCTRAALGRFYPGTVDDEIEGYFRLDGKCEECPKNPVLLFVFFFVAIFFLLIGGFILSQKEFNVAFISIGVDYFQVLSILRSARVEWPAFLKVSNYSSIPHHFFSIVVTQKTIFFLLLVSFLIKTVTSSNVLHL